jgi:phosphoglycerol transferase MdoB-like AlkP superfamily enzyme
MKTSQIAAKAVTRIFFVLLLLAAFTLYQNGNKFSHLYLIGNNKWTLVFPALLLVGFAALFITCAKQKYTKSDWNWLLVLNTVVLLIYCATLYTRITDLIK